MTSLCQTPQKLKKEKAAEKDNSTLTSHTVVSIASVLTGWTNWFCKLISSEPLWFHEWVWKIKIHIHPVPCMFFSLFFSLKPSPCLNMDQQVLICKLFGAPCNTWIWFSFWILLFLVGHPLMIVGALSKIKKGERIGSQNLNSSLLWA